MKDNFYVTGHLGANMLSCNYFSLLKWTGGKARNSWDSCRSIRVTGLGTEVSWVMFRDNDSSRAGARAGLSITCGDGCLPVIQALI